MATRRPRAEILADILRLKNEERLSYAEIAERLGAKPSAIRSIVSDPDGSKQRERRKRYQGVCSDCGGPTDSSNGRAKAPTRCLACARGETPSQPSARRTLAVRLCDIPLDLRLEGAREANRIEQGQMERHEILLAAIHPSEETYWLAESARALLEEIGIAA